MEDIKMVNAQELFNKYDAIINITMVNLYSLSKGKREIILSNIDRKNRDHLFILRVALLAKDIYNFPLKLETGFWNWLVLNWRMRKLSRRVLRVKDSGTLIDVQNLIDFMYITFKETIDENFEFAHIYNQFYKGELD